MPSSASYTESQTESRTESQSSRGPHITQWLPQLVLAAVFSLMAASIIGLSLSAVAFSNPTDLAKPGYALAQSSVMFASIHSLFYIPLHLLAAHKGEALYLPEPPSPFRHRLRAWSALALATALTAWTGATLGVAVCVARDGAAGGGTGTVVAVHLGVDMFACATAWLFAALLGVVHRFARRPFVIPCVSPRPVGCEEDGEGEGFYKGGGEKTRNCRRAGGGSSSSNSTLRGTTPGSSPVVSASSGSGGPKKRPGGGGGGVSPSNRSVASSSASTATSRARKMTRMRRFVLEAPTPEALSPVARSGSPADGEESAVGSSSSSSEKAGGKGAERRPGTTHGVVVGPGRGYGPGKGGACCRDVSPSVRRFGRKIAVAPRPGESGGGSRGTGHGVGSGGAQGPDPQPPSAPPPSAAPPPPPPPPPAKNYHVPGSWMAQEQSDEGAADDA